jgi:patatin-related protein
MAPDDDSARERLSKAIAEQELLPDDLQELRLALVMTGGVSLAVWMGGTALEFSRLIRADRNTDETYLQLLRLTRSLPRVDVIAGTSAGGLNGALLAYAVTQDAQVSGLRDLWLRLGALEQLLRQPTKPNPPSLMRGDEYFLKELKNAFDALDRGQLTEPGEVPMDLIITTTLLNAWPHGVPDTFGTIIEGAEHRGEFAFSRGASVSEGGMSADDDFERPQIKGELALASRCTASFPVAFEASFVPIGDANQELPLRPDMTDIADFQADRWVIDGGVLLNQPLRPALRAIFRQPASQQVRRVLAYVVPDPGQALKVVPDVRDMPSLSDVGLASMIRLPRNQSVSAELDELTLHNARVDAQRRRRELMVVDIGVDELARKAYPQYRGFRADVLARWLLSVLARGFTALELKEKPLDPEERKVTIEAPLRERNLLRERLIVHLENLPPERFPTGEEPPSRWYTTVETVERAAGIVLDLLRRGLALMNPRDTDSSHVRMELRDLRAIVAGELTAAQATRTKLKRTDELELAEAAVFALREDQKKPEGEERTALRDWANEALPRVLGDPEKLQPIVGRIAGQLVPAAEAVQRACASVPDQADPRVVRTAAYASEIVRDVGEGPGKIGALHRLLALDVVQLSFGGQPIVEQRVDLIQVSADAGNGLDPRDRADDKLAGLQLAHFGAFYKRSWRANDWMWGRHDAVQRLAQILLEPARLRQLGYDVEFVADSVETIAFGGLDEADKAFLKAAGPRPWDRAKAKEELSFLKKSKVGEPPPATIPMCAQAVARRLQLQVLRDELPAVRAAIRYDENDGAHVSTEARQFCDLFDALYDKEKPFSAADAVKLFAACRLSDETLGAESGSDLLARTATTTLAVTTSAAGGEASGLPTVVRRPMKALRGLGLMVYLVVRHALEGHRAGAMMVTGALFAGAALVGVGLVVSIPSVLMLAGLGAILGAVFLAAWRRKFWGLALVVVIGVVIALVPRIIGGWAWDWIDDDAVDTWEPVSVVVGLLVAALVLGAISIDWPPMRRNPPESEPEPVTSPGS